MDILVNGGIYTNLEELKNSPRAVYWGNGTSFRFLLDSDGFPFSLTHTVVRAGTRSKIQYLNHLEACYCISGEGELVFDGLFKRPLSAGTFYALKHEKHELIADPASDVHLICIFSPALSGTECHTFGSSGYSSYG